MPGYTYPGTDTLKNKLGATTHDELEEREAPYVAARHIEIEAGHGPPLQCDAEHLKALHRHLFQDVYEWAGHTRDEEVPLGDGSIATEPELKREGSRAFVAGPHIAVALDEIAAKLRDADYLGGLSRDAFAERAADLLAELNAVHPFREGNGRTQRAFVEQLAQAAGHDLDFSVISKERMIVASMAAHDQTDLGPMRRLFTDAIDPARRAALREAIEFLDRQQFPWNEGQTVKVPFGVGVTGSFNNRFFTFGFNPFEIDVTPPSLPRARWSTSVKACPRSGRGWGRSATWNDRYIATDRIREGKHSEILIRRCIRIEEVEGQRADRLLERRGGGSPRANPQT